MEPPAAIAPEQAAPAPRSRALRNALIAAFLLFQIAMPLRYYLSGGGSDERFSWRMFSTVRMQKCEVRVHETRGGQDTNLDLNRAIQIAWVGMLERNRPAVVRSFLERRCREEGVSAVRYERACQDTDGSMLPKDELTRDCKTGAWRPGKAAP